MDRMRRPCLFDNGTTQVAGFVIAQLIKSDQPSESALNQSCVFVFEWAANGEVYEVPATKVKFTDGSPAVIPEA